MKTEILYGFHPVFEALKADRRNFFEVYVSKDKISKQFGKLLAIAESKKISVKKLKLSQLKYLTKTDLHQGIGARVSSYPFVELNDIFDSPQHPDINQLFLLLDNVVDPQNLGAIIRTALCVGVNGVIITKDRSALPTPAVSKASAGALEHVNVIRVTNIVTTIKILKNKGVWIFGMDKNADKDIFFCDFSGSLGIVIGGEEKGIRSLVRKQCDLLISIPQIEKINSLNASVAAAVVMYEVFRQRTKGM
ncbi:MAG: 23S rRNA (guanosine(2251)-2'-O)-methyltransferase RlmB [Proteobacteria bacterium]|nr:23S rRNA (guanosine(2251)-2'-O)-methyltransferase RlmB [Pseudomonadota bacterium]MBU4259307.1 23S rRNA (guanosine(2251)-2'-O)-methyltransferase RlmB [Pseudomonadota bacterium]MBU4287137.1 23S rRNA (guanosine(2251)-2'-O)-methyltransferase RlmB [Pseudomonadota bacterium]MCG2757150.1 23S rRNA (guanosine(2251)-2'-O)-methyltransferase RlmB [Desulfobacteraceae bacterium]